MISFLMEAYRLSVQRKKKMARKKAYFAAALAFNRIHAYATNDGLWMCPKCNKVHKKVGVSAFVGLLFPACCTFSEGHRLDKEHATDTDWRMP